MTLYNSLSRILPFKKHYALKFLAVAFAGIHVPLIGIAIYFAVTPAHVEKWPVILFILALTLVATTLTLFVLNKLLVPLQFAKESLDIYLNERRLPDLPLHYEDEVGQLLTNIHKTIDRMDNLLAEKTGVIDLLSHDLRSPVSRIIGLSQVQKIDFISGNPNIYADEIISECNDILALLNDILLILKQEEMAGRDLQLSQVAVHQLVARCVSACSMQATQKAIAWNIDIEPSFMAEMEPTLFSQAFKNVIGNAIKFSQPGSTIAIRAYLSGAKLYISVSDFGMGFHPSQKDEIFRRFTNAGRRGTAGEPSTGLGLYLGRQLLHRMGGDLFAESEGPGTGATFTFVIPYPASN